MHAIIDRSGLLAALDRVKGARGSSASVYGSFLIEAADDTLRVTATDGDLRITATVPAKVDRRGALAASGRLHDVVRRIADGAQVELAAAAADRLKISAGRARFELVTTPAADFPLLATKEGRSFPMPAADLHRLLADVAFAQSTDDARYYLCGTYLHVATDGRDGLKMLRTVATDGHRLARMQRPCPLQGESSNGLIIPRGAVDDLLHLVDGVDADIDVTLTDALIRVATDNVELVAKLIDGTFPDYSRVIPAGNDKICQVDAVLLAGAVDRVTTLAEGKTRVLRITFARAGLTLACSSPDVGSAVEDVECDYDGPPIDFGFNGKYLTEILRRIVGEGVRLELGDPGGAILIRDPAEADALYVLMPTRA